MDKNNEVLHGELVSPEAKEILNRKFSEVLQKLITERQFQILRGNTPKSIIKVRPGKGGKTFSYIPTGYVKAMLNQIFGWDWDFELLPNGKGDYFSIFGKSIVPGYAKYEGSVMVAGKLTVRIRDPENANVVVGTIVKTGHGEKEVINGMTLGALIKSAESDALKRCATNLGIGLDLYWMDESDLDELFATEPEFPVENYIQKIMMDNQGITMEEIIALLRDAGYKTGVNPKHVTAVMRALLEE